MEPIVVDLPFPPSANRLWRRAGKRIFLNPEYEKWKRLADAYALAQGTRCGRPITGPFEAKITLSRARRRGDADNRVKAVLDWAQRVLLISNDKNAEKTSVEWGDVPYGCRLELRPFTGAAA